VLETFEGTAALAAGIDRGAEIIAIGTNSGNLVPVTSLLAAGTTSPVIDALGPSTAGTTRVLRVNRGGTVTDITLTKTEFTLDPVSNRYGAAVLDDNGKKVGYINLRTFIDTAAPDLRTAFASFQAQGITEVIVDLRYNGGGLVHISELFGDLLAADKVGQVFSYTTYRASKAGKNSTKRFASQPQAIAATKIAFIGTDGTASASELLANSFIPYLGANTALIGSNTYGKPVGQLAFDNTCNDRLRVVAFQSENANHQGDYFGGLAGVFPKTCAAPDDITHQLGDPNEAQIKAALDFLAGRACTAITGADGQKTLSVTPKSELFRPENVGTHQRESPGSF
jgi:C-terminal processing protease CtpA/Prc